MNSAQWKQYFVPVEELALAVFEIGSGPPIIFLSGGPGDDHRYLRPVAETLAGEFRCILYDQRGCGQSGLNWMSYNEETLHLKHFLSDLEALRKHLNSEKVRLVGHSWGANLALFYAVYYPEQLEAASLVGAGPINEELGQVVSANLNQAFTPAEKAELVNLRQERTRLSESEQVDFEAYRELHVRSFEISTRRSFYSAEIAADFIQQFRTNYNYNPKISKYLGPSTRELDLTGQLSAIQGRLQFIYGYQDFEPITQAYLVRERVPQTEICLINECGHVPWAEQPTIFYRELRLFLHKP